MIRGQFWLACSTNTANVSNNLAISSYISQNDRKNRVRCNIIVTKQRIVFLLPDNSVGVVFVCALPEISGVYLVF